MQAEWPRPVPDCCHLSQSWCFRLLLRGQCEFGIVLPLAKVTGARLKKSGVGSSRACASDANACLLCVAGPRRLSFSGQYDMCASETVFRGNRTVKFLSFSYILNTKYIAESGCKIPKSERTFMFYNIRIQLYQTTGQDQRLLMFSKMI